MWTVLGTHTILTGGMVTLSCKFINTLSGRISGMFFWWILMTLTGCLWGQIDKQGSNHWFIIFGVGFNAYYWKSGDVFLTNDYSP